MLSADQQANAAALIRLGAHIIHIHTQLISEATKAIDGFETERCAPIAVASHKLCAHSLGACMRLFFFLDRGFLDHSCAVQR